MLDVKQSSHRNTTRISLAARWLIGEPGDRPAIIFWAVLLLAVGLVVSALWFDRPTFSGNTFVKLPPCETSACERPLAFESWKAFWLLIATLQIPLWIGVIILAWHWIAALWCRFPAARVWHDLLSVLVLVGLLGLLLFPLADMADLPVQREVGSNGEKALGIIFYVAGYPALLGVVLIYRTAGRQPFKSEQIRLQDVDELNAMTMYLRRFVVALGLLVASGMVQLSTQRAAFIGLDPTYETAFPVEMLVLSGAIYTITIAAFYVLAESQLNRRAQTIVERIAASHEPERHPYVQRQRRVHLVQGSRPLGPGEHSRVLERAGVLAPLLAGVVTAFT